MTAALVDDLGDAQRQALTAHLREWVGAWPPPGPGITVVATHARTEPGWDGRPRPLLGAVDADQRALLAVEPRFHRPVAERLHGAPSAALDDEQLCREVGRTVGGEGAVLGLGVLRWVASREDLDGGLEPLGTWLPHDDPRVPPWLEPFGGDALVALDERGGYGGGVGVKRHGPTGHELAVVVAEAHRGRGWGRRLVATAARHELERVPLVTYLHGRQNEASARLGAVVGFPDRGWRTVGVFGGERGE